MEMGATNSDKSYYLSPIQSKNSSVSNVDLVTGKVSMGASDIRFNKSGLGFSTVYSSYNDVNQSLGTFTHSYEKNIDANISKYNEAIKSSLYATAKEACEEGWANIDDVTFLGSLENTKAIYNENNTLCDIYANSEIVASLLTKNKNDSLSTKLHTMTNPNGTQMVFFEKDGVWQSVSKNPTKFEVTTTGFKVTTLSDAIELYDQEGKLLSISNNAKTMTLSYNAKEQLEKITDAFSQSINIVYDENTSQIKEVTSYDDTKISYSYNDKNHLEKVTYADGSTKSYSYNSNGNLVSIKDASDVVTKTISYDSTGKATSTEGTAGANKTEFTYGSTGTTVSQTTGESVYEFKVLNSLLKTVKVTTDEGESSTEYDSHGYPSKNTNNLGVLTKTTYNEQGLLISKTTNADTADEKITLKSYATNFRKPIKVVEAGLATFYTYNDKGLLTEKIIGSVNLATKKPSAKSMNQFSKATLKSSNLEIKTSSFAYDENGLQTGTTQPNGATTANEYDENGNRAKTTNALGFSSGTGKFDKAGRPLESTDINGKVSSTVYDNMGRILSSTNDGQTTTYVYDTNGRTIKTTYADGLVDEKVYDASGNVVKSFHWSPR